MAMAMTMAFNAQSKVRTKAIAEQRNDNNSMKNDFVIIFAQTKNKTKSIAIMVDGIGLFAQSEICITLHGLFVIRSLENDAYKL